MAHKLLRSPDGNLVEFLCEIKHETELALLVSDGENEYWIPTSQIEEREHLGGGNTNIYIKEWLAIEKGIV